MSIWGGEGGGRFTPAPPPLDETLVVNLNCTVTHKLCMLTISFCGVSIFMNTVYRITRILILWVKNLCE